MVKDVLQQRQVVVAASWSPFEVLIHQDQITQSTFLAPEPFLFSKLRQNCYLLRPPGSTQRQQLSEAIELTKAMEACGPMFDSEGWVSSQANESTPTIKTGLIS